MEKFNRTLRGYDPDEVNNFLDKVISQVEEMVSENNKCLEKLEISEQQNKALLEKIDYFENIEATLNRAIMMAQKTTDQMKINAHKEADLVLDEAKKNANRIVNEALIRAEKTENEADNLTKNIYVFKKRLKNIIEAQLEMVNDIEKIEL
ncbi:MAG: DivIVA domain-containing protein [Bacilli bacterium]